MVHPRTHGIMAVHPNNKNVTVFGGALYFEGKSTAETTSLGKSYTDTSLIEGPIMPTSVKEFCQVQVNSTTLLFVGGRLANNKYYMDTLFYNLLTNIWTVGPKLNAGRYDHSCGIIKEKNGTYVFALFGLGTGEKTSEFLNLTSIEKGWTTDKKKIPTKYPRLHVSSAVSSKNGIYLVGGFTHIGKWKGSKEIYHRKCLDCDWKTLPQKLRYDRYGHNAMLLPESLDMYCPLLSKYF
jgi:hypothetical protein